MTPRKERTRWLFGDQLGPHFTDDFLDEPGGRLLMVESRAVFARRRFHRAKAHLVLSAMRHRAAELGERAHYVRTSTYAPTVRTWAGHADGPVQVLSPTSYAASRLVERLATQVDLEVLPARGFATAREDFTRWAEGRGEGRLLMEDFYRRVRRAHGVLLDQDGGPEGGQWNFDHDNREPPPRDQETLGAAAPWWPEEDDIDEEVRADLDRWERTGDVAFLGRDGPRRFAATREEALAVLEQFVTQRLADFGAHEDAMMIQDDWMAHSLLSAPMNLGLLDPLEVVRRAEEAFHAGQAPLASVEGFVRQVLGWRDYVWHLYWHLGEDYRERNALRAHEPVPDWFAELDGPATRARCLSHTLDRVAEHGWVHHIPRLMVLGNYAQQRGWDPAAMTDWFHRAFVDGYDWVMVPNVVGMSQHADDGIMATKPYVAGGSYVSRMSDFCSGCELSPTVRAGEDACPFTAGYWWFLQRHRDRFASHHRMARAVHGLDRLRDLPELVEQEEARGSDPP